MPITVICRFQDGNTEFVSDQYIDLGEAVTAALHLADLHGKKKGNGHGPPKRFDIRVNGVLEFSIAVIPGGLVSPEGPRG